MKLFTRLSEIECYFSTCLHCRRFFFRLYYFNFDFNLKGGNNKINTPSRTWFSARQHLDQFVIFLAWKQLEPCKLHRLIKQKVIYRDIIIRCLLWVNFNDLFGKEHMMWLTFEGFLLNPFKLRKRSRSCTEVKR